MLFVLTFCSRPAVKGWHSEWPSVWPWLMFSLQFNTVHTESCSQCKLRLHSKQSERYFNPGHTSEVGCILLFPGCLSLCRGLKTLRISHKTLTQKCWKMRVWWSSCELSMEETQAKHFHTPPETLCCFEMTSTLNSIKLYTAKQESFQHFIGFLFV